MQQKKFPLLKLAIGLCISSSLFMPGVALSAETLDQVVAVVNKDIITQHELSTYTRILVEELAMQSARGLPSDEELRQQILNRMILDKIQVQIAGQYGIEVDSITVSQALQSIAQQRGMGIEQFRNHLEAKGIAFDDFRNVVRQDLLVQRIQGREVMQQVSVTKSDVEAYLSSAAGQDQSGTEYRLAHILLPTPETPTPDAVSKIQIEAAEMVKTLRKGSDFRTLAMQKSAGRQALHGGDLGWKSGGELPTLFVNYVPTMQIGEVVGPIRSASGFHIIKLQDKRNANKDLRTELHIRNILIVPNENTSNEEAKTLLSAIREQIMQGGDFAKLAQKRSQDPRSNNKGGDMGWITESQVQPNFYAMAAKLAANEISEPFETEEGWNIVQVLDKRNQLNSSEAAWNKAMEVLTNRKVNEATEAWTKRIRDEARVEILADNFKSQA